MQADLRALCHAGHDLPLGHVLGQRAAEEPDPQHRRVYDEHDQFRGGAVPALKDGDPSCVPARGAGERRGRGGGRDEPSRICGGAAAASHPRGHQGAQHHHQPPLERHRALRRQEAVVPRGQARAAAVRAHPPRPRPRPQGEAQLCEAAGGLHRAHVEAGARAGGAGARAAGGGEDAGAAAAGGDRQQVAPQQRPRRPHRAPAPARWGEEGGGGAGAHAAAPPTRGRAGAQAAPSQWGPLERACEGPVLAP
mmetsp:Transcript_2209/g.7880  ORF Transcript_2209/g.7880 Transcript_2209/m.7880 type:complete len:251 (+) Transcript_2209:1061-1813(+)